MKNQYIYIYLDPRKYGAYTYENLNISFLYEPIYVGRGKEYRWRRHLTNAKNNNIGTMGKSFFNVLRKILRECGEPLILKIFEYLCINESLEKEMYCISCVGRKDLKTGPLYNRTSGGDGHRDLSPENSKKLSEKLSSSLKHYYKKDGSREKTSQSMTGREFSKNTREIMREGHIGKVASLETKRRMSEAKKKIKKTEKVIPCNTERKGEKHPLSILKEFQVLQIKRLLK